MVTGSSNIKFSLLKTDANLNSETVKSSHCTLQLAETGFSVLVLNPEKTQTMLLAASNWRSGLSLDAILARYEECLHELPVRVDHCESAQGIMNFNKFSLVPENLYTQGSGDTILSYTTQLQPGEHIYSDHWRASECILLYAVPKALATWFGRYFANGQFRHQSSALNSLYQLYSGSDTFLHLHVSNKWADFLVARNGKALFYNKFPFDTEEDLLYYLLFALEQNRVLATEVELHLSGESLKGEKLHVLLSRYLGEVNLLPLPQKIRLSSNMSALELRQHINLLGAI